MFKRVNKVGIMIGILLSTIVFSTLTIRHYVASTHHISFFPKYTIITPSPFVMSPVSNVSAHYGSSTLLPTFSTVSGNAPSTPTSIQTKGSLSPPTNTPTPTTSTLTIPPQGVYEGCHV